MKGMFISLILLILSTTEIERGHGYIIQVITLVYITLYILLNRKKLKYFL
ncbi:MAG: hypothetical protein ACRCZ0_08675 [Cetobacterium sp.]